MMAEHQRDEQTDWGESGLMWGWTSRTKDMVNWVCIWDTIWVAWPGPGSAVGEKGQKRGQIGNKSASKASPSGDGVREKE